MPIPVYSEEQGVVLPTLTNDTVATTETIVAQYSLGAGVLSAGSVYELDLKGQVSSTATLAFKIRMGTAGTVADALIGTFATTAAGVANQHLSMRALIHILTTGVSGTAYAGGWILFGNTPSGLVTAAFAAGTVNTTVAQKLSVTLVQSAVQTFTARTSVLEKVA